MSDKREPGIMWLWRDFGVAVCVLIVIVFMVDAYEMMQPANCDHDWRSHGTAMMLDCGWHEWFVCSKCGAERTVFTAYQAVSDQP